MQTEKKNDFNVHAVCTYFFFRQSKKMKSRWQNKGFLFSRKIIDECGKGEKKTQRKRKDIIIIVIVINKAGYPGNGDQKLLVENV